jgi:transcriptional regulator with XRE-family HTH domain
MNARSLPLKLGSLLRAQRERRRETLTRVAEVVGMQFQHLSKLERGDRLATHEQAAALARHFGLDERMVEARRMADEFWRENAYNPVTIKAIGVLQEDAGVYGTPVGESVSNFANKF